MGKPTKTEYYETANGPVKTLAEWKKAELIQCFPTELVEAVEHVLNHADEIIEILSHREKGRPNGKKDSKPRKAKETPATGA